MENADRPHRYEGRNLFSSITAMFLGFTLIRLRAGREAKPWFIKAGRYALVMAVTLVIGYISSRPALTGYLDTTATKKNTIPVKMQEVLKEFRDSTLEVTLYTNLLGKGLGQGMPRIPQCGLSLRVLGSHSSF